MQRKKLPALGVITNPAKTTTPGACSAAINLIARRPGKLESRRGHKYEGVASAKMTRIFPFGGSILGHFNGDTVRRLSGGAWSPITGTYTAITPAMANITTFGGRVRDVQANGSLYILANAGITRLTTVTGTPIAAGGPRGLSFDRTGPAAVLVTAGGWLVDQFQVAYRGLVAIQDLKGVTHYGEPSARTVVSNATWTSGWVTTESKNVVVRLLLPSGLTTDHFFQLYRSKQVPVGTQPDDDLQLVYQDFISSKNISDGYVEVTDIFPESLTKGAFIHTSPNFAKKFGDIDGENGPPPVALDACVYKDRLFLFNIHGYQSFQLTVLSVGGTNGIQNNDILEIGASSFQGTTGAPGAGQYKLITSGSVAQNNEQTALNLVELINKTGACPAYATYVSGPDDIPGKILLRDKVPNNSQWVVEVSHGSKRTCFDPVLSPLDSKLFNLARVATTVTATTVSGNHSYRIGDTVTVGAFGDFVITAVTATTFTYTDAGNSYPQSNVSVQMTTNYSNPTQTSRPDAEPNAWVYSKLREMGAFPIRNRGYVGERGVAIGRAKALRDSIVIWTYQGGLCRLTGDDPDTFRVTTIDADAQLVAPESVVVIGDVCIGWTTKGIIEVSDTGWRILSEDIQPTLDFQLANRTLATCRSVSFGVGLAADRVYELWVPATSSDSTASFAWTYSYATGRWTYKSVPYLMTCGTFNPNDNKGWWGDAVDASHGIPYSEKKTLDTNDYVDETIANPAAPVVANTLITKTVTFQPFAGNDAGAVKDWQQIEAQFETACPTSIQVTAQNELGAGGSNDTITPADTSPIVRWWPTLDAEGARLTVTIVSSLQEEFAFLGIELWWEEFGPEVVR